MTTKITGANIDSIANTGVKWNAVTVADGSTQLSASAGNGYFLDTNAGVIDVKLPTSPTRGDTIILADYGNNFATNRVVVDTGGKKIDSVVGGEPGTGGFTLETNGAVVELVFADDTAGWIIKQNSAPSDLGAEDYATFIEATGGTVTTSGNFKIHSFTGDGCFVVSAAGKGTSDFPSVVDYMVIAGGGAGGNDVGGGGGAGGYRESSGAASGCFTISPLGACVAGITLTAQTYPISVGAGGAGTPDPGGGGANGSNSVFSTITSTGGGGGARQPTVSPTNKGKTGGSGGGSRDSSSPGAAGNTPSVSPPQGNPGGAGPGGAGSGGAGGGGATAAGAVPGPGGAGATSSINGTPTARAGGGGGGGNSASSVAGGGASDSAGTANTGGGGGGGNSPTDIGKNGGSGLVIIRYKFQS